MRMLVMEMREDLPDGRRVAERRTVLMDQFLALPEHRQAAMLLVYAMELNAAMDGADRQQPAQTAPGGTLRGMFNGVAPATFRMDFIDHPLMADPAIFGAVDPRQPNPEYAAVNVGPPPGGENMTAERAQWQFADTMRNAQELLLDAAHNRAVEQARRMMAVDPNAFRIRGDNPPVLHVRDNATCADPAVPLVRERVAEDGEAVGWL